jgi:hypothetical protein
VSCPRADSFVARSSRNNQERPITACKHSPLVRENSCYYSYRQVTIKAIKSTDKPSKGKTMSEEMKKTEEHDERSNRTNELPKFIIKTVVIAAAMFLTVKAIIPDIPKIPATERNKLLVLSFIQNPYVLWRLSILEEEKGNLKNANMYIEAAIGLLEMNGASDISMQKYRDRLKKLNTK